MLYLFVWENYFRKKLLSTWKQSFSEKFSEHNIIHVRNVFDYDFSFYEQNLLSNGFFSEKNLFIVDDFPMSLDENDSADIQKLHQFFLQLLPNIPQENIVVFNNSRVDKRSKIYKEIVKIAQIKDFSIENEAQMLEKISEVWGWKITTWAAKKMIELKWINFPNIQNELDKLFITRDTIDVKDLSLISKDIEESIFDIIHDILSIQTAQAITKLKELSYSLDNPYLLYNSIVANLRIYFYIFLLKKSGKRSQEIKDILDLWNRAFLVDRSYKISLDSFNTMYKNLIEIDANMKAWKLLGSENEDMMYEIEKSLII